MYILAKCQQNKKILPHFKNGLVFLSGKKPLSSSSVTQKNTFGKISVNLTNLTQLMDQSVSHKNQWECNNCGHIGMGKPPSRCKECKSQNVVPYVVGRPVFGAWWESLSGEDRQELLRAHGSHEQHGGAMKKQQGGSQGGNQHSNGNATAVKKIKEKYENGKYDDMIKK